MYKNIKGIFNFNNGLFSILVGLIFAGIFCTGVYVVAANYVTPGTMNPSCAPGAEGCTIAPPFVSNMTNEVGDFTTTGKITVQGNDVFTNGSFHSKASSSKYYFGANDEASINYDNSTNDFIINPGDSGVNPTNILTIGSGNQPYYTLKFNSQSSPGTIKYTGSSKTFSFANDDGNIIAVPQLQIKNSDGTVYSLPTTAGAAGKVLAMPESGTDLVWTTVDAFPSQTDNAGKFLTTNGTTASWASVDLSNYLTSAAAESTYQPKGNYLTSVSASNLDNVFSSNGLLKRTGSGAYSIDTNTYITSAALSGYATESWVGEQGFLTAETDTNAWHLTGDQSSLSGEKSGSFNLSTTGTGAFAGVVAPYAAPSADSASAFQIRKADKSTAVLNVDTTHGRVGVGVAAPDAYLDINGAADTNGTMIKMKSTTISQGTKMLISSDNDKFGEVGIASSEYSNANFPVITPATSYINSYHGDVALVAGEEITGGSNILFQTGKTEKMRIAGNGNVGIGTTEPGRKLEVLDSSNPQLRLAYTNGSVYSDLQTTSNGYLHLIASGPNKRVVIDSEYLDVGLSTILLGPNGFGGSGDITFRNAGTENGLISPVFKIKDAVAGLQEGLRFSPTWINSTPGSLSVLNTVSALGTNIFQMTATAAGVSSVSFNGTIGVLEGGTSPTYHTIFTGGDQSGDINYTLPAASGNGLLKNTNGTLSWDATAYMVSPMTTLGDIIFENSTPAADRLAGNTTTTKKYLQSVGSGSAATAPSWQQIAYADISGTPTIPTQYWSLSSSTLSPATSTNGVQADGGFLSTGTTLGFTIPSGAGTRMMWIPSKYSFRAGRVTGTQWDSANIGNYSFAAGYNNTASGYYSASFGYNNIASNGSAVAFGNGNTASGASSATFGNSNTASGSNSVTFGHNLIASGEHSIAFGDGTHASADYTTTFGSGTTASADYSTAFGIGTEAGGTFATVFGSGSKALGMGSIAAGYNVEAGYSAQYSFAFGDTFTNNDAGSFEIGFQPADGVTPDFKVVAGAVTVNGTLTATTLATGVESTSPSGSCTNGSIKISSSATTPGIYYCYGGAWHYSDQTGGFQIPKHESVDPISGEKMEIGDFVVPLIDKVYEDGTAHGIWAKWSTVKAKLLAELSTTTSGGYIGSGNVSTVNTDTASLTEKVSNIISSLGITIADGVTNIATLVTQKLTADTATVKYLQMVASNGDVYCTWIDNNGSMQKEKGECANINVAIEGANGASQQATEQAQQAAAQAQQAAQKLNDVASKAQQVIQDAQETAADAINQVVEDATQKVVEQATPVVIDQVTQQVQEQQPAEQPKVEETPPVEQNSQPDQPSSEAAELIQNAAAGLLNKLWSLLKWIALSPAALLQK